MRDNYLWFHIDGDRGASFWDNCKTYEDLLQLGVTYVTEDIPALISIGDNTSSNSSSSISGGSGYRVKRVEYLSKGVTIIQQNENGPCPLIAIANILALRGNITIDSKDNIVNVDKIIDKISLYLYSQYSKDNSDVQDAMKNIADLQFGLDVNFNFNGCDSFEDTSKTKIFKLLNIRVVHGWLVDPMSIVSTIIGSSTYNDLTLQLVALEQQHQQQQQEESATKQEDNKALSNSSGSVSKEEKKLSVEEGRLVNEFLVTTSHQLTEYGILKLLDSIKEDELVVFFRNNHFSTLTKHSSMLFNLVTDIGYERERLVVWDLLDSVDGNSKFYSGDFGYTDDSKKDEIINTALLFGFTKDKIEEAIAFVTKPNEELKTDDVLTWLNKHSPL